MMTMRQEIQAPAFPSMHIQQTTKAKTEGVSLNPLVLAFIEEELGRRNAVL